METEKPIERALYEDDVDKFGAKLAKLGFRFVVIEKPETLILGTDTGGTPDLDDLTKESRKAIDSFLKAKGADGGLVLHLERKERVQEKTLLRVTLLPYRLIPKSENA
jgi:hypothetical protein